MAESRRICVSCQTPNEEDARYCEGCGASLARECATCGVKASATARFCRGCGAPLDGQAVGTADLPSAGPARKTVTVMFADLAGSTTFEENVDAETAREVIGRYHELLRSTADRHRAGMTKYIGDGFMAVWGVPEVGPDDAAHAVDAAAELQERFVDLAAQVAVTHRAELALRVAVNTGEVVVGAGDADLVGDALNVGARLEAECPRGCVVVGEETWRSTRGRYSYESLGQVQVKGRSAPVAVYQWRGRQSESADAAPFVGRSDEVRRLQAALDDAIASRAARLVAVVGDPGVGKSRLAAEFTAAQDAVRVVEVRCAVERTVALGPIIEVLRARDLEIDIPASVPERDRLLRDLNGLTTGLAGSVEENFWALRRFVEVLASNGPVLLVLDDIQWAGTLLLDFIEHLVEWVQDTPVLVLALARPELREIRPDLVTVSRWVSEAVPLGGLDAGATAELAANVLGAAQLPDELLRRLPSSTGGNPLFVRELIGMLAHDGVLVEQPGGWRLTIDVDAIAIPPTIHALLASRLERLDSADRRVLEIASVVGSDFSVGIVRALAGSGADGVNRSLNRLRRLELTQPSGAYVGDEPVWRFHHVLIRDVAYRRLLKSERADLHQRLADWVAEGGASVAFDSDEMIARHLEAAYGYRLELGSVNESTDDLALRAARHYATSARRALDRDELVSAGTQAARGAALANADPAVHAELLLTGCEAFLSAGDVTAGAPLVDELERISNDALEPWAACYRCQFIVYTAPERLLEVEARLQSAIDEFARRAEPSGLAKANRVRASARFRLGRVGDAEIDLFEALIAARQSGDHRQITAALGAAPGAALWGPSPVPKAGGRCLDVVRMQRMTTAAPSLEATSMRHLAVLELLRGRPDKARTMLSDARQIVADLGLRHGLMETELFAGIIESMEGDPVAAEPHFRTALEGLDALGVGADAGLAAALLARSVLAQGRIDEADRYASESEQLAGRNLKTAIAWRAVRAEILAAQGRHEEAATLAREAVLVAAGTDLVLDHADACLALSRVLIAAGDAKGANAARSDAQQLYSAKEAATAIGRAKEQFIAPAVPFAAAEPVAAASRLAVTNQSSEAASAYCSAMQAQDVERAIGFYANTFEYEDHRSLGGEPVVGREAMRLGIARVLAQYTQFEVRVLAVRGQRINLAWNGVSDDDGNRTNSLHLFETDDDGLISYHARFDEDDFESAFRELERRYYAGEGSAFAEGATAATMAPILLNRNEFDRYIAELCTPDLHVENRSRSAIPDRSVKDLLTSFKDLQALTSSTRTWTSATLWLSPSVGIVRLEREAVGQDGEDYAWTRILVSKFRDGRFASICEFELDDEEAAFAYAEERMRATTSQLAVTNQSCEILRAWRAAAAAHDLDGTLRCFSDRLVYEDRRRFTGDPIVGRDALRAAVERVFAQYTHFESRVLAVRGQRLHLLYNRWVDDDGNETIHLDVHETDDDGLVSYRCRFDEDDFEGAYRELERRYYAGEGSAFAAQGPILTNWITALNRGHLGAALDDFAAPGLQIENRSRSVFGDRSYGEFRASIEELNTMIASSRTWHSSLHWLSPDWVVFRSEREAVGDDGEQYTWTRLYAMELRDGRAASLCEFEVEDEDAAFDYAEERMQPTTSRLAVTNQSCAFMPPFIAALRAQDVDGVVGAFADGFVYDDRRKLSGDPIVGVEAMRAAVQRIFKQYNQFEFRILAVRGERLNLLWSRWSDKDGNETTTLYVNETDDNDRVYYHARFDEEDFIEAYRELEHRYYAGEGAPFAEAGALGTEWVIALNQGDLDVVFHELTAPDMRVENRSLSLFGDRSAAELRATFEDLNDTVLSARIWCAAVCWASPELVVARFEREAFGRDGEVYAWTRIHVAEIRDGQVASSCRYEIDDEDAAFAYAEKRVKAATSRFAVTNRSCESVISFFNALNDADVEGAVRSVSERFVFDDRRRLSGDSVIGRDAMRMATERVLEQYSGFEFRVLAVRGQRLNLLWSRFSDADGNETTNLNVSESDDDGLLYYLGRFDEDDFDSAYRELERRYYADEGAAFAEGGALGIEWVTAINRGDLDRAFGELTAPGFRIENRSGSAFADRSLTELRSTTEELNAMVSWSRIWFPVVSWLSPTWAIQRMEREAVGQNGETYTWSYIDVSDVRDGQLASVCRFDIEDEDEAFAYAEERVRATTSRLAVTNRAVETNAAGWRAMHNHDVDGLVAIYADRFVFDDRRRLSGDPIEGRDAMRAAASRVLEQYSNFESHVLAVRGDRLVMVRSRWSDEAGNETTQLHTSEVDVAGRLIYDGRFDDDDFDSAYRELDRRYYAEDGAEFAEAGALQTEWLIAMSHGDLDRVFGELTSPDLIVEDQRRAFFPERSASEFRSGIEELFTMVGSARTWNSVSCFVSPTWCVARNERETVGQDGVRYAWTRISVAEVRDGRVAFVRQFEIEDEEAAFAFAEEQARKTTGRLDVTNRASQTSRIFVTALDNRDLDAAMECVSNRFVYDDRRRLHGNPIGEVRVAIVQILEQYNNFEMRTVAVRGDRLHLCWGHWSDDSGNEAAHLHLHEIDDDGRLSYEGRFDEVDFEGAYRELDRRYFVGEGAAFAESGVIATEWITALNRSDYDRAFGELSTPGMLVENRSRAPFPNRSAAELRATFEELADRVAISRTWLSAMEWFSPAWFAVRLEREATGHDGEHYQWLRIHVIGLADGRMASVCQFELDDVDEAFAYAAQRAGVQTSRLEARNQSSEAIGLFLGAMKAHDVAAAIAHYPESFVYDDHRRLSGDPVVGRDAMRAGIERHLAQYTEYDFRVLAVRGERLHLVSNLASDADGNKTSGFTVFEADDGLITYQGRFDEIDFEGAYRELNRRYYAGEGAAFAEAGAIVTDYVIALHRGDLDRAVGELSAPDFRLENRSRSVFGDRSATEFRSGQEELNAMVTSVRTFNSAICWLSPAIAVSRFERDAIGRDGERYAWNFIIVSDVHDGRVARVCQFDIDDEEAAFAFADELVRAAASRLAVSNRASNASNALGRATDAADLDGVVACYADAFVFDDRRRLSGDPVRDAADLRRGIERILAQYSHFESRTLAVRGDRLTLLWSRWWDDSDNETAYLHVREVDDDGRFTYDGRFDEDDFEGAYRELEGRYHADEGAAFAEAGSTLTDIALALNQGDVKRVLDELTAPGFSLQNRSQAVFDDRSADEFRNWETELNAMVASTRSWNSAVCWLSPTAVVGRFTREAVGIDGERYAWTGIIVTEVRDGQMSSACLFDEDDEEAAFAYAEGRVQADSSRLAVTNLAQRTWDKGLRALQTHDADFVVACYAEPFVYDDRRRLAGNPLGDVRSAHERILAQYNHFEGHTLAVRGDHLHLGWMRWSNDSGFETLYLIVHEVDDNGRIVYEGRFDEDDFESAYRELDERYYAGEGMAFAAVGTTPTEVVIALNRGDFDKVFDELAVSDAPVVNRSRLPFPDRSADFLRTSFADLETLVTSTRTWFSALCWVSEVWTVVRFEREAVGADGEQYAWTHLVVLEIRGGRIASMCEFELDDEDAAFAYAQERILETPSRLAVDNRASRVWQSVGDAMNARDADAVAARFLDSYVYDDHWALGGDAPGDIRAGLERVFEQYSHFEGRSLAVRGDTVQLASAHWSNDDGYETDYLHVTEIDENGLIVYYGRFGEDDFENAYRELEQRYCSGEGAAFAEIAMLGAEYLIAINQGAFDKVVNELTAPGMRIENRTRSGFPDRSVTELGASFEELNTMVGPSRSWNSAVCWLSPACGVVRHEREAFGEDGEHYAWAFFVVFEAVDGRATHLCQFEVDDEAAAFAYAEERVRQARQR